MIDIDTFNKMEEIIEKLVFEEFPGMNSLSDKLDIRKIQGYENYYRIRIGNYRIRCEIEAANKISVWSKRANY